jgi:hypothetical protein
MSEIPGVNITGDFLLPLLNLITYYTTLVTITPLEQINLVIIKL